MDAEYQNPSETIYGFTEFTATSLCGVGLTVELSQKQGTITKLVILQVHQRTSDANESETLTQNCIIPFPFLKHIQGTFIIVGASKIMYRTCVRKKKGFIPIK